MIGPGRPRKQMYGERRVSRQTELLIVYVRYRYHSLYRLR